IARAVAIGIGTSQIEAHAPSVGEDKLALATAIGQWGYQRAGIDGVLSLRLRREDCVHVQEFRKRYDQKVRRPSHKNQLVPRLSMRVQPGATLHGQLTDHLSLTELPRMRLNVCGALARQILFSFSERVQRERGHMSRQPGNTPAQLAPSHQAASPQISEESYLAGLSRQERVVDVEQSGDGPLCQPFNDIIERRREAGVTLHNVGGPGEHEPPDSTGASID